MFTVNTTTFGAAYGKEAYGCGNYQTNNTCTTEVQPEAPLTGLFSQPTYITLPLLLGVAIVLGSITFLISRKLRKNK